MELICLKLEIGLGNNIYLFEYLFILILGILCHYFYKWSKYNYIIGLICPSNESVWEHIKLIIVPSLLWMGIFFNKTTNNYVISHLLGIVGGSIFIILFYYAYTFVLKKDCFVLDIVSFIIGVFLKVYISYKVLKSSYIFDNNITMILLILILLYPLLTIFPPKLNLFKDPITNTYGIKKIK